MIDLEKFSIVVAKAEKMFGRLDDESKRIYWENVKGYPEETIVAAVDRLISTHGFYKFPTVAEVLDAIGDHHPMVEIKPRSSFCERCGNVGRSVVEYWVGQQTYHKEHFCECEEGQRQKKVRLEYYEKRRQGLTNADGSLIRKERQKLY